MLREQIYSQLSWKYSSAQANRQKYNTLVDFYELILMPKALLCIKTNLNSAKEVLQELKTFKEVQEAFTVIGEYDIIARVESETFDDLVNIDQHIKRLTNVREILSMLLLKPKKSVQEQENGVILV